MMMHRICAIGKLMQNTLKTDINALFSGFICQQKYLQLLQIEGMHR